MAKVDVEKSPARKIADKALDSIVFQNGLIRAGFTIQNDPKEILEFRDRLEQIHLSPTEEDIMASFEPFGYLTTHSLIARDVLLDVVDPEQSVATHFYRIMNKLRKEMTDLAVVQTMDKKMRMGAPFRGIGCYTNLNPTDMALTRLIERHGRDSMVSPFFLAQALFPHDDEIPLDKKNALLKLNTAMTHLRHSKPTQVTLETRRVGEYPTFFTYFRWANAFGYKAA